MSHESASVSEIRSQRGAATKGDTPPVTLWRCNVLILTAATVGHSRGLPARIKRFAWGGGDRFALWIGDGQSWDLKFISVGILTCTGMKTSFHTDVSPRNQFSGRHWSECQLK